MTSRTRAARTAPSAPAAGPGAELLGTRKLADRVDVNPRTIIRWIRTGRLPGQKVGGRWKVAPAAFDEFVSAGRFRAPAPGPADAGRASAAAVLRPRRPRGDARS